MPRVLLLLPTTSYRGDAFIAAAGRAGIEMVVGTDRCRSLARMWPDEAFGGSLPLDFRHPTRAVAEIVSAAAQKKIDAIVPTSDETAVIAALAARALGLQGNSEEAAYTARNKAEMRKRLAEARVASPAFQVFSAFEAPPDRLEFPFPVVVKPLLLSASRGVIRADDADQFATAFMRVQKLIARPELAQADDDPARRQILVERFVPGVEVALEGLLAGGVLRVLALFDKPDPLDGPFFEETIYVTPSRLSDEAKRAIAETTAEAAAAMGLREGPVHAELRLLPSEPTRPSVIEVAARSIGGLCARTLRFGLGGALATRSLEELVLRNALGEDVDALASRNGAAGVMMVPIPRGGVLRSIAGEAEARAVFGIEDVVVTMRPGERVVPLPEGASYLGFIFARGERPDAVEAALRSAHGKLRFDIAPVL